MAVSKLRSFWAILVCTNLSLLLVYWKPKSPPCDIFCVIFTMAMAPMVQIEPNGCQALLAHNDAIDDLKAHGWDAFLMKFYGYTLRSHRIFHKLLMGLGTRSGM